MVLSYVTHGYPLAGRPVRPIPVDEERTGPRVRVPPVARRLCGPMLTSVSCGPVTGTPAYTARPWHSAVFPKDSFTLFTPVIRVCFCHVCTCLSSVCLCLWVSVCPSVYGIPGDAVDSSGALSSRAALTYRPLESSSRTLQLFQQHALCAELTEGTPEYQPHLPKRDTAPLPQRVPQKLVVLQLSSLFSWASALQRCVVVKEQLRN